MPRQSNFSLWSSSLRPWKHIQFAGMVHQVNFNYFYVLWNAFRSMFLCLIARLGRFHHTDSWSIVPASFCRLQSPVRRKGCRLASWRQTQSLAQSAGRHVKSACWFLYWRLGSPGADSRSSSSYRTVCRGRWCLFDGSILHDSRHITCPHSRIPYSTRQIRTFVTNILNAVFLPHSCHSSPILFSSFPILWSNILFLIFVSPVCVSEGEFLLSSTIRLNS